MLNSLEARKLSPDVKVTTPSVVAAFCRFLRAVTNRAMPGKPFSALGSSFDSPSLLCRMVSVKSALSCALSEVGTSATVETRRPIAASATADLLQLRCLGLPLVERGL